MSFFTSGGFEIVFTLIFILAFGTVILVMIKNIGQLRRNNSSPRLTVRAEVVSKRSETVRRHDTGSNSVRTFIRYYVTFQVDSGDRMEMTVGGSEYGMLAEGDVGDLSFQGTRYLGFERH